MNYDTMEAGPEMDMAVGMLMGFARCYIRANQCRVVRKLINSWHDDEELWRPSTDIAHAWQVVERIDLLDPHIGCQRQHGCAPVWTVELVGYAPVSAPTAQLAICRAALVATPAVVKGHLAMDPNASAAVKESVSAMIRHVHDTMDVDPTESLKSTHKEQ